MPSAIVRTLAWAVDLGEQAIQAERPPVLSLSDRVAPSVIVAIAASRSAVPSDTSSSGPNPRRSTRVSSPFGAARPSPASASAAGSAHPRPK